MAAKLALLAALAAAALCCLAMPAAAQYDQQFAESMVHVSSVAYCNASVIERWECPACSYFPGFKLYGIATNAGTFTQAYVGVDPNSGYIIIGFRGTDPDSIRNWIDDLKFDHVKTTYPHCDCEVHSGFYDAHLSIRSQVVGFVQAAMNDYPSAEIVISGHSLGAALATFSASHLVTQLNAPVAAIYVFGLPRCGDAAFATWFDQNVGGSTSTYHVVHNDDIVPHLPPELFGFHHVATEVWYGQETGLQYTVCNGSGEDPSCADSVSAFDFSVADHLVYLDMPISSESNC